MALMPVKSQTSREAALEVVNKTTRSLPREAWVPTANEWDSRAKEARRNQAYFEKQAQFTNRDYAESMVPVYETASRIIRALATGNEDIKIEFPELRK